MEEPKKTVFDQPEYQGRGSGPCETVVIQTEAGPVTINKSDFDAEKHKLVGQPLSEAPLFTSLTKAQLQEYLTQRGVAFDSDATKAALVELCEATVTK